MLSIKVREATELDRLSLWEVFKEVYITTYPNDALGISSRQVAAYVNGRGKTNFQARMYSLGQDIFRARYVVAIVGGDIVGYGVASRDPRLLPVREIKTINILPVYQRRGVGTAILKDLLVWVNAGVVWASVADYVKASISFFDHRGFEIGDYVADRTRLATIDGITIPEIWLVRG